MQKQSQFKHPSVDKKQKENIEWQNFVLSEYEYKEKKMGRVEENIQQNKIIISSIYEAIIQFLYLCYSVFSVGKRISFKYFAYENKSKKSKNLKYTLYVIYYYDDKIKIPKERTSDLVQQINNVVQDLIKINNIPSVNKILNDFKEQVYRTNTVKKNYYDFMELLEHSDLFQRYSTLTRIYQCSIGKLMRNQKVKKWVVQNKKQTDNNNPNLIRQWLQKLKNAVQQGHWLKANILYLPIQATQKLNLRICLKYPVRTRPFLDYIQNKNSKEPPIKDQKDSKDVEEDQYIEENGYLAVELDTPVDIPTEMTDYQNFFVNLLNGVTTSVVLTCVTKMDSASKKNKVVLRLRGTTNHKKQESVLIKLILLMDMITVTYKCFETQFKRPLSSQQKLQSTYMQNSEKMLQHYYRLIKTNCDILYATEQ